MIPVRSNPKRVDAYAPTAEASEGVNDGLTSSTLFNRYGTIATRSKRATLRNVTAFVSPGRTYMSVLPGETKAVTFLNVALLLLVAIVPYLLNSVELVNPSLTPSEASAVGAYASTLFGLDLTGIMLILAAFAHVISIEERNLVAPKLARLFRNGRNRLAILSLATAVSIAPQFWE